MSHPRPSNHDLLYNWLYENAGRTPLWQFPDQLLDPGIRLQRLDFSNYHGIPDLFADDDNRFLEPRFRTLTDFYEYVGFLMAIVPYSPDHGGVDYLVYTPGGALAGIVHLYDLSCRAGQEHRAYVGFQIGRAFRGTDLAHRAVSRLERYATEERGLTQLLADTIASNTRSIQFLERRGYAFLSAERRVRTYARGGITGAPPCGRG